MFQEKLVGEQAQAGEAEPEPLYAWTLDHRAFLAEEKPLNFKSHPYLVALYQIDAQRVVISKAAQLGVSEYAVSYAIHAADQRRANVLYIFPSERTISDFSAARIAPAIEASAYLKMIVENRSGGRRGVDQTQLKRIRNRYLYLRGGMVKPDGRAPQLKSIDADVLIMDEFDEMDPRAPSIAQKRLGHSRIAEERLISTPSYPGMGVHAKFLESDQRHWFVKCPHCGRRQQMTMQRVIIESDKLDRPVRWHGMEQGRAFVACDGCSQELDRLGPGEWVAAHPGRGLVGFHMNKLFSPHISLDDLLDNLQTTDETKRKEAYNQDWGLPYKPKGGGLDDEILDACKRPYALGAVGGERCVMGVDVGKVLNVVIRGPQHPETGERPLRFAGEVAEFADLGHLIRRHRVKCCVIDANPETRLVRSFQAGQRNGVVWPCYYSLGHQGMKGEEPLIWNDDDGRVDADRTRMLDETVSRFTEQANTIPANAKNGIPNYYDQLKAPVRLTVARGSDGIQVARYVETGADHYAHAENYCTIASMRPVVTMGNKIPQGKVKGWR